MPGWLRDWKRRRVLARHAIPPGLWSQSLAALPFLAPLSADEQARLRELAILFLAEKEFAPVHGVVLSDADRLAIALQAALPVLNLGLSWYDDWSGIVVHPGDFRVQREQVDENGVVHEWEDELAGESWAGGPVVLSWEALGAAGSVAEGGLNVVIHEFAHKLDMRNGEADGLPPLHADMDLRTWHAVLSRAWEGFCDAVDRERETFLDPYAAEHPAEFFAVASEAFFEAPQELRRRYPDLYAQFVLFYRQDPAARSAP